MSVDKIFKERADRKFKRVAKGSYAGFEIILKLEHEQGIVVMSNWCITLEIREPIQKKKISYLDESPRKYEPTRDYVFTNWKWLANWRFNRLKKKYKLVELVTNGR